MSSQDDTAGRREPRDDVGSLAEEAARLAAAFQDWAHERAHERAHGLAEHDIADGSAACRLCPLCRLIAVLRQLEPQTVDQIGAQVQDLVRSLRTLLDVLANQPAGRHDGTSQRGGGVQKIELSDDGEEDVPWT
jgi:hypothetical protein